MIETTGRGLEAVLAERLEIAAKAGSFAIGDWYHFGTGDGDAVSNADERGTWMMPTPGVPCEEHADFCFVIARHIAANDPPTVTLLLNLALAATRQRQVAERYSKADRFSRVRETLEQDYLTALRVEDACIDALEAHMCGREGAS